MNLIGASFTSVDDDGVVDYDDVDYDDVDLMWS